MRRRPKLWSTLSLATGLALGVALSWWTPAAAQGAYVTIGTQVGCTSEVVTCSSGTCTRAVPDGGSDAGVSLDLVRSYTVQVCGTSARPLAGAGSLLDYHVSSSGVAKASGNTWTVSATTSAAPCDEAIPYALPAYLPSTDKMVWAASGVTISNWDGGSADTVTVTVCPAK